MLENVHVLCHSSILIKKEKTIYIDPFRIKDTYNDADIIMITHDHFDHYSEEDIEKVKKEDTIIVLPTSLEEKAKNIGFKKENLILVEPNKQYNIQQIQIQTIPAYNIGKKFHAKENNWIGYILEIDRIRYYIPGDTDITEENKKVKCDVAFVPVGGTYTMDSKEAAELVNYIKPKIVVPIHYGEVVGSKQDAVDFANRISKEIKCEILIK